MKDQLDWIDTHHHRDDPSTSERAAASVQTTASKHRSAILSVLYHSPEPLAAEPIADVLSLTTLQVMKRISDLRNDGLVEDSGFEHTNRSGRKAVRWARVTAKTGLATDLGGWDEFLPRKTI